MRCTRGRALAAPALTRQYERTRLRRRIASIVVVRGGEYLPTDVSFPPAPIAHHVFVPSSSAADGDAFMPLAFQKTIIGNPNYDAAAPKQPFWPTFFYVRGRRGGKERGVERCVGGGHRGGPATIFPLGVDGIARLRLWELSLAFPSDQFAFYRYRS
jgi:hypothetical protein